MLGYANEFADGGVDPEFLLKFPSQALCVCFAFFDGSAGELPFSGQTVGGATLSDQDRVIHRNYSRNHIDLSSSHGCTILQANRGFNLMRIYDE